MKAYVGSGLPARPRDASDPPHVTVLGQIRRNFGWLAGSTGFSAIASLVYVGLTARALGPARFGSFAMVMTYCELITNLGQFQSWKAIIGFGALHQQAADDGRLTRLFGYAASLDLASNVIGAILGILGVVLISPWLHWTGAEEYAAAWFGTVLFLTSGTAPSGVLRLAGRFDVQVYTEALAQVTRLAGCVAGWMLGAGVSWFLCVWALAASLLILAQWTAVIRLGHRFAFGHRALRQTMSENPGLLSFMLKTNVSGSLNLFYMQCGTLIVGARVGAVEAGGFRLAHRFSLAMMKPVEIAAKALFPELARLVAAGEHATVRRVLIRVSCISAAFASLVIAAAALWGRGILALVAGRSFGFAHQFLLLLCVAAAINVAGFAFEPYLNAHRRPGSVLRANIVGALLYGVLLLTLLPRLGASSAAFASIVAAFAIILQLAISVGRILARPESDIAQDAGVDDQVSAADELTQNPRVAGI
jgi:O-antigen/teichoic acid export membrane protein